MTIETATRPSTRLRAAAAPVWAAVLEHPYIKELASGTLPRATFRAYVKQDWLYLEEFLRTTAIIASRAADGAVMRQLLQYAQRLVTMEHHFHHAHQAELELDFSRIDWEMSETNYAYTRHMLACAHGGSTVEALAALLPCPCVYAHVGEKLAAGPRPPVAMYASWIDFYAPTASFAERVGQLEATFDRLAAHASPDELARAERNYVISSRYEWMFWDAPYRGREWPV